MYTCSPAEEFSIFPSLSLSLCGRKGGCQLEMFCHLHYFQQQVAGINSIKVFCVCVCERERESMQRARSLHTWGWELSTNCSINSNKKRQGSKLQDGSWKNASRPHVKKPWLPAMTTPPMTQKESKTFCKHCNNLIHTQKYTGQQSSPMISHYTKPNQPGNIFSRTVSWWGCYDT